jgi:hypothetical protein
VDFFGKKLCITEDEGSLEIREVRPVPVEQSGCVHSKTPVPAGTNLFGETMYLGIDRNYDGEPVIFLCDAEGRKYERSLVAVFNNAGYLGVKSGVNEDALPTHWKVGEYRNIKTVKP